MLPNVQAVMARSRELKAIEHKFDQAGGMMATAAQYEDPCAADLLYHQGQTLAQQADQELAAFYARHPNCLSKKVMPWAQ